MSWRHGRVTCLRADLGTVLSSTWLSSSRFELPLPTDTFYLSVIIGYLWYPYDLISLARLARRGLERGLSLLGKRRPRHRHSRNYHSRRRQDPG